MDALKKGVVFSVSIFFDHYSIENFYLYHLFQIVCYLGSVSIVALSIYFSHDIDFHSLPFFPTRLQDGNIESMRI